jgi:hypothetical protein
VIGIAAVRPARRMATEPIHAREQTAQQPDSAYRRRPRD